MHGTGEIVAFAGLVGARRTELMKTIFGIPEGYIREIFIWTAKSWKLRMQDAIDTVSQVHVSEDRRQRGLSPQNDEIQYGALSVSVI